MGSASTCRFCAKGGTLGVTDRVDAGAPPVDAVAVDAVDTDAVDAGAAPSPIDALIGEGPPPPVDRAEKEHKVDVTRYLAAAAYLDETFRAEVLSQTMRQKHRFIAPSYGVDIGCVARHCLASRRLSRRRDVILTALIILGVWALHLPLVFAAAVFVGGVLVASALASPNLKLRWRIFLSIVAYIAFAAFALHPLSLLTAVAALFVVLADAYERRYRVAARRMNAKVFRPEDPAYGRERPDHAAADRKRTAHLDGHQDGNVVVYSGFSPFIGSGTELKRWSFAVALKKGRDSGLDPGPAGPLQTTDIHAHVAEAMKKLGLEGCTVVDRFYVSGRHVGQDPDLFFYPQGPQERFPRLRYTIDDVAALEAKPCELVRQYADIKVAAWQSELILSTFVRFTRTAHYLFVEAIYFLLPPLKSEYYRINSLNPHPRPHELPRLFLESAAATPLLWLKAPIRVAKWMATPLYRVRRQRRIRHAIEENQRFDYGATGSVRESGSDREYAKYLQKMDIERFHKIIDRHLLASLSEFLKAQGVDTTELDQRMLVIVNDGIWLSRVTSTAGNVAAWTGPEIPSTRKGGRRRQSL